jgi:excisionase family DNA binding protein
MVFDTNAARQRLLTEKEAADLLCLSASTLRMLRSRKMIPHFRFGRRVAYSPAQIESFKASHEQQPQLAA